MSAHAFKPWEIPTGGKPPAYSVVYEESDDGRRVVHVSSPWVLAVQSAAGKLSPFDRSGVRWLEPGESLVAPASHTGDVEQALVFRAQLEGYRAYGEAHAAQFDDEMNVVVPAPDPDRWWWHRRELPHGLVLHLLQASSNARLSVSINGDISFQGSWCYPHHHEGWRAVLGWNGWGDPPDGWTRHLETARRRIDGTAATEFIFEYERGAYR